MRLDGLGDIDPVSMRGPSFTIAANPGRDEVGRSLDNEVSKKKRKAAAKWEAESTKRRPSSHRSGSRTLRASSARGRVGLSPAAQRLLNSTPGRSKSGFGDSQLRQSYTVRPASSSRQRHSGGGSGSSRRPSSTSSVRSGGSGATPVLAGAGAAGAPVPPQNVSVTDNLLNL
jgi:hypothetical protein